MAESRPEGAVVGRDEADLDGGGYQQVALGVLAAIARNERAVHILDVRNRGAVPGLDDEAVVEVPCLVDANGAHPVAGGTPEAHQLGLLQSVKAVERETIAAAVEGSRERALRAFALHPLVDSVDLAGELLARYLDAAPELAQRFR